MFKKIKKTIQKDLHKRYEQLEEKFLAFERRLYSHLEERLDGLENQFDQISEILRQQTGKTAEPKTSDSGNRTEPKPEGKVKESKATKTKAESKKTAKKTAKKSDVLQDLPGLGGGFEKKLNEAGIDSFQQLANLHESDIAELNNKIPGFKIRYERYDWRSICLEKLND